MVNIWPCPRMVNWDPCTYNGELKQRRFWATHVNRKLSGPFSFMGSGLAWIFAQIVSIRIKKLSNTNLAASSHIIKGKASLPVDVRRSETPFLELPNILCGTLKNSYMHQRVGDEVAGVVVYLKFTFTYGNSLLLPSLLVNCTTSSTGKSPQPVL